jgi:hypothetical protein
MGTRVTGLRAIADYQRFGDGDGKIWMMEVLTRVMEREEIDNFEVTGCHRGAWGIEFITFTVDFPFGTDPDDSVFVQGEAIDDKTAKNRAVDYLNATIGDDDIFVRWVAPIEIEVAS